MAERDPERLLSQALRAQAASMPPGRPPADWTPPPSAARSTVRQAMPVRWVLLLAFAFGLLAGAAAGLVTVL